MKLFQFFIVVFLLFAFFSDVYAQTLEFDNPIAEQRADPWVHKSDDGTYYLIATVPEYDRIVIRKATSINGLKNAEEKVIWRKHEKGVMGHHIWAPELHRINGTWYIHFAAGEAENIWNIRMWVLSNDAEDPMEGEWKEEGQIKTQRESFSLDATTFEHRGKRYLIWAQNVRGGDHGTALVLSEMKSPTTLIGPEVVITEPEFNWERMKYNVNEKGYYGEFGGAWIPEMMFANIDELRRRYLEIIELPEFRKEFDQLLKDYVGRPSPLYFAGRLSEHYGTKIYLKREDLNHTGSHKLNNTVGQILLAEKLGKTRIIAETGAGQHGVATATVCALKGLKCVVYMGALDVQRQAPNVK